MGLWPRTGPTCHCQVCFELGLNPEKGQQAIPPVSRAKDDLQQRVPLLAADLGLAEHHGDAVIEEGLDRLEGEYQQFCGVIPGDQRDLKRRS